jgi:tryptophan synthase beta chain
MPPDSKGHFGEFGGRFIAETVMPAGLELAAAYWAARRGVPQGIRRLLREYAGPPPNGPVSGELRMADMGIISAQ